MVLIQHVAKFLSDRGNRLERRCLFLEGRRAASPIDWHSDTDELRKYKAEIKKKRK